MEETKTKNDIEGSKEPEEVAELIEPPSESDSGKPSKKKKPKKHSKKSNIIFWSVGLTLSLAAGIGGGYVLGSVFNGGKLGNYDGIDESLYAPDYSALEKKFNKAKSSSDISKSMTACEMANYSLYKLHSLEKWKLIGIGSANASVMGVSVQQKIHSAFIGIGNEYFEESLSHSSFAKAASRMYEDYSNGASAITNRYVGNLSTISNYSYSSDSKTEFTREEYKSRSGRYLDGIPCIYLISDKCLASKSQAQVSGIETGVTKTSTGYTIEIELDPTIAVANYVKQMQFVTELAGAPYFYYVHLTFYVDSQLNLISLVNNEKYDATTAGGASSTILGSVTTTAYTTGEITIPSVNEYIDY